MRHARGYRRLNRTHEHRKALFSNMAGSLIEHDLKVVAAAGSYTKVFDFGVNHAGFCVLRLPSCAKGTPIQVRPSF